MMLSSFNSDFYNSLLSITDADSAFVDRDQLFSKLAPLFSREEYRGKYEVCLVHRHFDLKPGERMVSHGLISLPTSSHDPSILPERWTAHGEAFEFRKNNDSLEEIIPPPPPSLLEEFRHCIGKYASVLGICHAEDRLSDGQVCWETTNDHIARSHVLEIKERVDLASHSNLFETCWRPQGDGSRTVMACCVVCVPSSHFEC